MLFYSWLSLKHFSGVALFQLHQTCDVSIDDGNFGIAHALPFSPYTLLYDIQVINSFLNPISPPFELNAISFCVIFCAVNVKKFTHTSVTQTQLQREKYQNRYFVWSYTRLMAKNPPF